MAGKVRSVRRYDRQEMARVLKEEGLEAARARWTTTVAREALKPIARALGVLPPYYAAKTHPGLWKPEWNALLGTKPDPELAGELLVPVMTIIAHRHLLGIPPATSSRVARAQRRVEQMALITDAELAKPLDALWIQTRIPIYQLAAERRRRGLLAAKRNGQPRKPSMTERREGLLLRRQVVILALRETFPGITLEELGETMGVTRERVRQIEMLIPQRDDQR